MLAVAVDPGKTTGIAVLDLATKKFESVQLPRRQAVEFVIDKQPNTLIIEKFLITPGTTKKGVEYDALYTIGAILQRFEDTDTDIIWHTPTQMRPISTTILKNMGWYKPANIHANDAACHLTVHMAESGILTYSQMVPNT
jgi:hypothetical protein